MTVLFVLVPLSLCSSSTVLFLLLDRVRRTHFGGDGVDID
jgi:hypothetical protein